MLSHGRCREGSHCVICVILPPLPTSSPPLIHSLTYTHCLSLSHVTISLSHSLGMELVAITGAAIQPLLDPASATEPAWQAIKDGTCVHFDLQTSSFCEGVSTEPTVLTLCPPSPRDLVLACDCM